MTGVLVVNLGTPDGPGPREVKKYLREFLMDPLVIDIPYLFRWFLVNVIILWRRPKTSSKLYHKIWTQKGSPLLVHGQNLVLALRAKLGPTFVVELGMRYGNPSVRAGLEKLSGCDRIVVLPLFPQFSEAALKSAIDEVKRRAQEFSLSTELNFVRPFFNDEGFLDAFARLARSLIDEKKPDHIVFSFHGIPERQIRKAERVPGLCLKEGCCDIFNDENSMCYRAQCFQTARLLALKLGLSAGAYSVAFQSRLGRTPWIKPYTDDILRVLAAKGSKIIVMMSPSFAADCLETLEELAIRENENFRALGGTALHVVPCLNANPVWVDAASRLIVQCLVKTPATAASTVENGAIS